MKWIAARRGVSHYRSHRDLLAPAVAGPEQALDAIVVSAARPASNLLESMRLAAALGTRFVCLCSRQAQAQDVRRVAETIPGLRYAIVPVPAGYRHELLRFETDQTSPSLSGGLGDLSVKRNLGLLFGYRAGWSSILFLDDDIRGVGAATVRRAVDCLVPGGAVGMPAKEFPDNSVVCHADRRGRGGQDVFVSGSALVVDCADIKSFFPRVYNEDWLFLAPLVAAGSVARAGSSRQLPYDPFEDWRRAESEEFGDLVAEGMMGLLHTTHGPDHGTDADYWRIFLDRRKGFIEDIVTRTPRRHGEVLQALQAAERRRAAIAPADLAGYVRSWQRDLVRWTERLSELTTKELTFVEILRKLKLADRAIVSRTFDPAPAKQVVAASRAAADGDLRVDWEMAGSAA